MRNQLSHEIFLLALAAGIAGCKSVGQDRLSALESTSFCRVGSNPELNEEQRGVMNLSANWERLREAIETASAERGQSGVNLGLVDGVDGQGGGEGKPVPELPSRVFTDDPQLDDPAYRIKRRLLEFNDIYNRLRVHLMQHQYEFKILYADYGMVIDLDAGKADAGAAIPQREIKLQYLTDKEFVRMFDRNVKLAVIGLAYLPVFVDRQVDRDSVVVNGYDAYSSCQPVGERRVGRLQTEYFEPDPLMRKISIAIWKAFRRPDGKSPNQAIFRSRYTEQGGNQNERFLPSRQSVIQLPPAAEATAPRKLSPREALIALRGKTQSVASKGSASGGQGSPGRGVCVDAATSFNDPNQLGTQLAECMVRDVAARKSVNSLIRSQGVTALFPDGVNPNLVDYASEIHASVLGVYFRYVDGRFEAAVEEPRYDRDIPHNRVFGGGGFWYPTDPDPLKFLVGLDEVTATPVSARTVFRSNQGTSADAVFWNVGFPETGRKLEGKEAEMFAAFQQEFDVALASSTPEEIALMVDIVENEIWYIMNSLLMDGWKLDQARAERDKARQAIKPKAVDSGPIDLLADLNAQPAADKPKDQPIDLLATLNEANVTKPDDQQAILVRALYRRIAFRNAVLILAKVYAQQ